MEPLLHIFPPPAGSSIQQGGLALQGGASSSPPLSTPPAQTLSPPMCSTNLNVAFINCVGQSRFNVSKQLEIQRYIKSCKLDILHLQECKIDEESFASCHYICSNFNIFSNNTPNDTCYGTASLVRCDIEVTNLHSDDAGRVIVFDAVGCTWGNLYLPSGTDGQSRSLREHYSAEIMPKLLLQRQSHGAIGGDLNSIISLRDSNRNASTKMSPSFRSLVSSMSLSDSFRVLYPQTSQFSRYYSNDHHGEGASRIDRCYHWGQLKVLEAEYNPISFSDHLSHRLVFSLPSPLDRQVAPEAKPQYRIPPEIVEDLEFQTRLKKAMQGWNQVLDGGADLLIWWQHLVKKGICHIAKVRGRELLKQRRGQLNLLSLRLTHLSKKVSRGDYSCLTALEEVKLLITKWYDEESKKIILTSKVSDMNMNEKVRIFHHGLHQKFKQKSSILKLQTESGIVEGHTACAAAVEKSVAAHLLQPAVLDKHAQDILLKEVEPCFTETDNTMLEAAPSKSEIEQVLKTCNSHAAPGTDGLTAFFYKKCWEVVGDALTKVVSEVFSGSKPTSCQRTSLMVFGNKPGKKAHSLLISDRRKLSLLNVDFKILSGIEASRIRRTMTRTISPHQLVTGGDRRISHGVALARDAINAASTLKSGCGILDTDLIAAFCNMVLTWCYQVMERKGLSPKVIERYKNLYSDHFSIVVVNNISGRCIKNVRLTIRQGDKFSMEMFTFGMDPVLVYLEKRLKGIIIHQLPVQGPVLLPLPPSPPPPEPPPALVGLPPLPPPPPVRGPIANSSRVLPPLLTKYTLAAFCDDLKPAITSIYEFSLVERVMKIFELSSGCKMHRSKESEKCKFLPLATWRKTLKQGDIPFDFFTLSDHLDFLGVTLKATCAATRTVNGDTLQERVRKTVGPWKGGRFMALNLRPHSVNCFALSKLQYRFNVIDPRVSDIKSFLSQAKSFLYADLLEKPEELILYRDVVDGGLGLYHIQSRAAAALISTFLQTSVNPNFRRNYYHNVLYRHYVLGESLSAPPIPPHFKGDFFVKLREMKENLGDLTLLTFREIYKFLVQQITHRAVGMLEVGSLLPLKCEQASPATDWARSWHLARLRGLGPDLTSFLLKMLWGILPCKARISRILPKISPECQLCNISGGTSKTPETLEHAIFTCEGNKGVPDLLLKLLKLYIPSVEYQQVLTLDLKLDQSMELPMLWIVACLLFLLWQQRQEGKVCPVKIRAELEARCRLLREGKKGLMQNCSVLAEIAIRSMYSTD